MHETPIFGEITAGGILLRRATADGWLWLLLCNAKRGEWGFPKGHRDPGESIRRCALRECAEETGIGLLAFDGPAYDLVYQLPNNRVKRVTYFPAWTSVEAIRVSPEHRSGAWCTAKQVIHRLPHENLRSLFQAHLAAVRVG